MDAGLSFIGHLLERARPARHDETRPPAMTLRRPSLFETPVRIEPDRVDVPVHDRDDGIVKSDWSGASDIVAVRAVEAKAAPSSLPEPATVTTPLVVPMLPHAQVRQEPDAWSQPSTPPVSMATPMRPAVSAGAVAPSAPTHGRILSSPAPTRIDPPSSVRAVSSSRASDIAPTMQTHGTIETRTLIERERIETRTEQVHERIVQAADRMSAPTVGASPATPMIASPTAVAAVAMRVADPARSIALASPPMAPPSSPVQISIGRVEIRAAISPAPVSARGHPRTPQLSLDDYLRQRHGGGR